MDMTTKSRSHLYLPDCRLLVTVRVPISIHRLSLLLPPLDCLRAPPCQPKEVQDIPHPIQTLQLLQCILTPTLLFHLQYPDTHQHSTWHMAMAMQPPLAQRAAVLPVQVHGGLAPDKVPARGAAQRPNAVVAPGVYEVLVTVLCPDSVKREFMIRTDCGWAWFKSEETEKKAAGKKKGKKRTRAELLSDFDSENDPENATQAYRELSEHLRCERHGVPCFVEPSNGEHIRVTNKNMMIWAKEITLGRADKHHLPHCIGFERSPKKPCGKQGPHAPLPAIHVHIQQPKPRQRRTLSGKVARPKLASSTRPTQQPESSSTSIHGLSFEPSTCTVYSWLKYPTVEHLLSALDAKDLSGGFLQLHSTLVKAAFTEIDEITVISPAMLYLATHIPPTQIITLFEQAEVMIRELHEECAAEILETEQYLQAAEQASGKLQLHSSSFGT
ncbi:hypothetical protein FKP32DRAFT_1680122 [Trametes sanguinea]|nr:hypothetical protein FKP32DRAFT_1680122 [Trametes sanguinea]